MTPPTSVLCAMPQCYDGLLSSRWEVGHCSLVGGAQPQDVVALGGEPGQSSGPEVGEFLDYRIRLVQTGFKPADVCFESEPVARQSRSTAAHCARTSVTVGDNR